MKVKELKEILDTIDADQCEVMVAIKQPGTIGGTPAVCIDRAARGIDWDGGKFLLFPAEGVVRAEPRKKRKK